MKPCCGRCKFWNKQSSQTGNCSNEEILEMVVESMQAKHEGISDPLAIRTKFYSSCGYFKQRALGIVN